MTGNAFGPVKPSILTIMSVSARVMFMPILSNDEVCRFPGILGPSGLYLTKST